jgi:small subunit ribosomal protein S8
MSQDIVSDILNQIMNIKKAKKDSLVVDKSSKLLLNILNLAKENGYLEYETDGRQVTIKIKSLNEIRAVKPRYTVPVEGMDKYVRRFLPAKNFGILIISTNKGIMTHVEAKQNNLGGCIIAYIF